MDTITASRYVGSLVCVLVAGYLALKEKEGWGWFLFAAVVLAPNN